MQRSGIPVVVVVVVVVSPEVPVNSIRTYQTIADKDHGHGQKVDL